jgi:hypothetical protein
LLFPISPSLSADSDCDDEEEEDENGGEEAADGTVEDIITEAGVPGPTLKIVFCKREGFLEWKKQRELRTTSKKFTGWYQHICSDSPCTPIGH